jgi:hypothetical protein
MPYTMRVLMDADCLIKLTKSKLKELVCMNFTVVIPKIVKVEVIDNAHEQPDAIIIKENLEKKLITVNKQEFTSPKGEYAVFAIFQQGNYDAACSDDKRFIKRLEFFNIPYITPSVFIAILLRNGKLTKKDATEKLESLSPFISNEEYNVTKIILENWRDK